MTAIAFTITTMVSMILLFICCLHHVSVSDAMSYDDVRGTPYTVTYDHRAIIINGKRTLIQSGSIHYPRSTPDMWPSLMNLTRDAHLNAIQIYLFWDYHMPSRDVFDPQRQAELVRFIQTAADAGLFVIFRIGPYVCAEWNYGGMPIWLREDPSMVYRTFDQNWMREMKVFVDWAVGIAQPFLARRGGPIILAQIENEYGNVEIAYGTNGSRYVEWCAQTAASYNIDVPWIMCQQDDAPSNIINTCNGFYCDNWLADHFKKRPTMPGMWTENWPGWFQAWGEPVPHRPVEDVAFSVARFIARGGTMYNYYMWHGGTTFGRHTGGPNLITSYDYDVALNEYGLVHNPKYSHSAALHSVLEKYANVITSSPVAETQPLGDKVEAHQYGTIGQSSCLVFLSNYDVEDKSVVWHDMHSMLAAWSVEIRDCSTSPFQKLYSTAVLNPFTPSTLTSSLSNYVPLDESFHTGEQATDISWYSEPAGGWSSTGRPAVFSKVPTEQINTVKDQSDYLWYTTNVTITPTQIQSGWVPLTLSNAQDYVSIFVDGQFKVSAAAISIERTLQISVSGMTPGWHSLQILCETVGTINYGAHIERYQRGLMGQIKWAHVDIRSSGWNEYPMLRGEQLQIFSTAGSSQVQWDPNWKAHRGTPLSWWKINIPTPPSQLSGVYNMSISSIRSAVYALDLGAMGKGMVWVNGYMIGRHWSIVATEGKCAPCDYRGPYANEKCRTGCGELSQRYYHVPAQWLAPVGGTNMIVIFDEQSIADPSTVILKSM